METFNNSDSDFSQTICLPSGEKVMLCTNDEFSRVDAFAISNGKHSIGYFEFDQPDDCPGDVYRLCYMSLEGLNGSYKKKGVGREILKFFSGVTGAKIYCEKPGDREKEDGSHVVGDGVPFVRKMKSEGLIGFVDDEETDYFDM